LALNLSLSAIERKAKDYCAYQERSHIEITQKLYSFGLHKTAVEKIMALLIEEGYLNEERFALQFASGRFNLKKWGRIKIKQALQQRKVSIYNINIALSRIDENKYRKTLISLANRKFQSLKTGTAAIKKLKTTQYLLQKGYERNLIVETLRSLPG